MQTLFGKLASEGKQAPAPVASEAPAEDIDGESWTEAAEALQDDAWMEDAGHAEMTDRGAWSACWCLHCH